MAGPRNQTVLGVENACFYYVDSMRCSEWTNGTLLNENIASARMSKRIDDKMAYSGSMFPILEIICVVSREQAHA